ncbi:hypothetical protein GCM10022245_46210 [Streptomyces mayteni]
MAIGLVPFVLFSAVPAHAEGVSIEPIEVAELPYCEDDGEDESLLVEFVDVPEGGPATEWQEFTYRVTNLGDEPMTSVYAFADIWAFPDDETVDPYSAVLEWNVNGEWREVQFESDYANGYFGIVRDLQPGESAEARMRGRGFEDSSGRADLMASVHHHSGPELCLDSAAEAELTLESTDLGSALRAVAAVAATVVVVAGALILVRRRNR